MVESLALALGLSLRPQAQATILPIGSVGSRCDSSKDTVQTLVEKRGGKIRVAFKLNRMNHVQELVVLRLVGNAAELGVSEVLLRSVMAPKRKEASLWSRHPSSSWQDDCGTPSCLT